MRPLRSNRTVRTRAGRAPLFGAVCAGRSSRLAGRVQVAFLVSVSLAIAALSSSGSAQTSPPSSAADRTLRRVWDPVILEGKKLNGLFDGEAIENLAVYAYTAQGFRTIPFQIDLIGEDGMVVPGYVNRVRKKAVYDFIPNTDKPSVIKGDFQVLFMAKDTGGRYPGASLPEGFAKASEIEVLDPATQEKGWAYLMRPKEGVPPRSETDYVSYELIKKDARHNEQIRSTFYVTGFPDADKPFAYGYWIIPEGAGGSGENILQTFRVRVQLKVLGVQLDLDPKNNIVPYVLSYNDGPIRVTRRVHSSVVIKGLKMDWLAGDTKLETESQYYPRFFYFDGEVNLPGFLKKLSKINAMFTTDFAPQAAGLLWYDSANAATGGCLVDGVMSPQEAHLSPEFYRWSLIVGPQGGWANILNMHAESIRNCMELFYLDDRLYSDEKEPNLHGTFASTGYALHRLDKVEDKVSFRTYIFAIPKDFTTEETRQLLNLVYQPVAASVPRSFQ